MKKFIAIILICFLISSTITSQVLALDYQSRILQSLKPSVETPHEQDEKLINLYNYVKDKYSKGKPINLEEVKRLILENRSYFEDLFKDSDCSYINLTTAEKLFLNNILFNRDEEITTNDEFECIMMSIKMDFWWLLFLISLVLMGQCLGECNWCKECLRFLPFLYLTSLIAGYWYFQLLLKDCNNSPS